MSRAFLPSFLAVTSVLAASVASAQPVPPVPPAAPSEPPPATAAPARVDLLKLRGQQVMLLLAGDRYVEGKLVEMSDLSAVIEKDGGERVTVSRDQITEARARVVAPVPEQRRPGSGKQVILVTESGEIAGKLVEVSDTVAVIEKDGGERVTVQRSAIKSKRERLPEPPGRPGRNDRVFGRAAATTPADEEEGESGGRYEVGGKKKLLPGYIGFMVRPIMCMVNCAGVIPTVGGELGYKFFGIGLRGFSADGGTFLSPDLRFFYEYPLSRSVSVAPAVEMSPTFVFGGGVTVFQLVMRPALRFSLFLSENLAFFAEPFAMDLGLFTTASGPGGSLSSGDIVVRYDIATGVQLRL